MSEGEAGGVRYPGDSQEREAHHCLQRLPGQLRPGRRPELLLLLLLLLDVDDDVVLMFRPAPVTQPILENLRSPTGLVVTVENII